MGDLSVELEFVLFAALLDDIIVTGCSGIRWMMHVLRKQRI